MSILLFDLREDRKDLLPFTYTRPIAEIRVGILTIKEKWQNYLKSDIHYHTESYLSAKFSNKPLAEGTLMINGAVCPDEKLTKTILKLSNGQSLIHQNQLIACRLSENADFSESGTFSKLDYPDEIVSIKRPWDIFHQNGEQIRRDFNLLTKNRESKALSDPYTVVYNPSNVFLEEGATVKASIINAENGPVYLGKNSVIHEGSMIKGPFSLGEGAHINMGAKMKGDNTIGPYCKVGGEVSNSVFFGYSNKGHDGFLGNSVIGEWCNLGADTNSSNLKNNYSSIKVWNYKKEEMENTGLTFCGLLMGDHSKSSINTMFNTGTVVGVAANIFGSGFPPKFIPSFSWLGDSGFDTFKLEKSYEVAEAMMSRRGIPFTNDDKEILNAVFRQSANYRNWEESI